MDYSKEDVKKDINKDFQSLIQNLQNISNDIQRQKYNTFSILYDISQCFQSQQKRHNRNRKIIQSRR